MSFICTKILFCIFLDFIDVPDLTSEHAQYLDQKKSHFARIAGFKKTRQKVVLKIFWWIEIVSMDPKSNVKLLGDHFEYSYIFKKYFVDCFLSTSLLKTVDIKLFFYGD